MSDLKPGWKRVRFGDMVTSAGATRKVRGWTAEQAGVDRYVGLEHLDSNSLAIRRWGSPDGVGDNSNLRHFEPGDVILARRGIELRKVGLAQFSGVASGHALVFRAKPDVVLPQFLGFFLQSDAFMARADRFSVGSLSRTVNLSALVREEFALPPIEEQRRLVEVLEASNAAVDTLVRSRETGALLRKALLVRLFQFGTRQERRRPTPIGHAPESWDVVPLGDRYQVQLGKMLSDATRHGDGQVPYLRNANVQWNRLDLDDVATMSMSAREREKFSLQPGDILACEGRHVGKSALWRGEVPGATYQKALHRLRRLSDRDVPEYLLHCLQYYSWRGRFVVETGETTIPHLPAERFRAMLFPFPTRAEQEEIARAIHNYDSGMSSIGERIAGASDLVRQLIRLLDTQ